MEPEPSISALSPAGGAPDEYSVSLGEGWEILPPDVEQLTAWVRNRVEAATTEPTGLEEAFIRTTTADLRRALSTGAELIALFAEVVPAEPNPDAGEEAPPAVLSASVALAFVHRSMVDGLAKFTPGFIRLGLRRDSAGRPLALPREISSAGGPAVETQELIAEAGPLGQDALRVSYYKPLASGEWLGILTFQTPNVEVADEWVSLFRAMAETLTVKQQATG